MSAFGGLKFTQRGLDLQAKAQIGTELQYTRIGIGDGNYNGDILDITNLVHQVLSLPITSLSTNGGQARIGSALSNQDLQTGFYLREIGVFATDPDLGEILYCYANSGIYAGYVPPAGGADPVEKEVELITTVGTAANVTAIINSSVFATIADVDSRVSVVQEALDVHVSDGVRHITAVERTAWNSKQNVLGFTPENAANKGVAGGYAGLDNTAKIPTNLLPDSILGQVEYISTWNASTNTPTLPEPTTVKGNYYVVDTAGTYLGIEYKVGDWAISNGVEWQKVDNTDAVPTVFGRTGNIVSAPGDYTAAQVSFSPAVGMTSTDVQAGIVEAFQSGSEFKSDVAAAITAKGVPTAANANKQTFVDNIEAIQSGTGGNAGTKDVLAGKTFTNDGGQQTGDMVNYTGQALNLLHLNNVHEMAEFIVVGDTYNPPSSGFVKTKGVLYEGDETAFRAHDSNFRSENIRAGTTIFGLTGTLVEKVDLGYTASGPHPITYQLLSPNSFSWTFTVPIPYSPWDTKGVNFVCPNILGPAGIFGGSISLMRKGGPGGGLFIGTFSITNPTDTADFSVRVDAEMDTNTFNAYEFSIVVTFNGQNANTGPSMNTSPAAINTVDFWYMGEWVWGG